MKRRGGGISSSQVSKTFTVQTDSLGYFAVIDSSISGGEDHEVKKVTLNKISAAMKKGDKLQLSATVLPQTATNKSIRWESSDNTVATIDSKGVITAVSAGSAKITATAVNGVNATCTISVTDPKPQNRQRKKSKPKYRLKRIKRFPKKENRISRLHFPNRQGLQIFKLLLKHQPMM